MKAAQADLKYLTVFLVVSMKCIFILSDEIYKLPCRRSGIFKKTGNNQKLLGEIMNVIHVETLPYCIRGCLREANCQSVNVKKIKNKNENFLCELVNVTIHSGILVNNVSWKHYEPISSVSETLDTKVCTILKSLPLPDQLFFLVHPVL